MKGPEFLIYGLTDPRTGEVRYIGRSSSGLKRPLAHGQAKHLRTDRARRTAWIKSLIAAGVQYGIQVLQAAQTGSLLNDAERAWIKYGREQGWRLTNHTDGGEGRTGNIASLETRRKMSAARKNVVISPETRRKIAAAQKLRYATDPTARDSVRRTNAQRWSDPAAHTRMSDKMCGRVITAIAREKMSQVRRGRTWTAQQRAAHAASTYTPAARTAATRQAIATSHGARPFTDQHGVRYDSVREAGRITGIDSAMVSKILKGKRPHCRGFVFQYTEENRA